MRIIALDQSLSATGVCRASIDCGGLRYAIDTWPAPKTTGGERLAHYRHLLIDEIVQGCDLMLMEGYAYNQAQTISLSAELGGVLKCTAAERGVPVQIVEPSRLRKWAVSTLPVADRTKKDAMLKAAFLRFGLDALSTEDEADAAFLGEIGVHLAQGLPGANTAQCEVLRDLTKTPAQVRAEKSAERKAKADRKLARAAA